MSSLRVGLTGGIGTGKSEVSRRLESYGAVVIDADLLARQVVAPGTQGLAQVVEAFGEQVLGPDGSLDRERLGEIVFADASLRGKLNAIIHPLVGARMRELEEAADEAAIVVHDIPLLAEGQRAAGFDVVIVVDVPAELQISRLAARGLPEDQARARMAAQATREQRLAIADVVIDNSGTLNDLDHRVAGVWADLMSRVKN